MLTQTINDDVIVQGDVHNERYVSALHNAIGSDELYVEYQPRLCSRSGCTNIVEALVRWRRDGIGSFYPSTFLEVAIHHKLIFQLDLWVFDRCCRDLTWLRRSCGRDIRIAVNITATECESSDHIRRLLEIADLYGVSLSDFEFEITESEAIVDPVRVEDFCITMTEHGASISLDDFGTGHSTLFNLSLLPVDSIKIDRSFVQNMLNSARDGIIVQHLIELAHEMGINIVGEGVEQAAQFEHLSRLGCDQLQGYHISRPLVRDRLLNYLGN